MKKDACVYPSILTYYNDNIGVTFPDLPGCVSNASNLEEAAKCAKEALSLHLYGMEEDNCEIPASSPIDKIQLEPNQAPLLVEVYMPLYRDAMMP